MNTERSLLRAGKWVGFGGVFYLTPAGFRVVGSRLSVSCAALAYGYYYLPPAGASRDDGKYSTSHPTGWLVLC